MTSYQPQRLWNVMLRRYPFWRSSGPATGQAARPHTIQGVVPDYLVASDLIPPKRSGVQARLRPIQGPEVVSRSLQGSGASFGGLGMTL
jgi:hypothetical protein